MSNEIKLDIAIGYSANSKKWKNVKMSFHDFLEKIKNPVVTSETLKEFKEASLEDQSRIKDVGGYVGAYLRGGKRSPSHVLHKQLLTLDIDFANPDFWMDFQLQYSECAIIHGTHKHSNSSPRFRLLIPLSREVSGDEYSAISRKVAGNLGIELFDPTTFETNRLMFWPSVPKDQEYYFRYQKGPLLDADSVLESYVDWKDMSSWPTIKSLRENSFDKQEDPKSKKGLIGAFCRTYGVHEAIEQFIPKVYINRSGDRYTYSKGSTSHGIVVYDDLFSFSHHGTDPTSGKLCNSYDLIRLHKFGHFDTENETKSSSMMSDFIRDLKEVKKTIALENISESKYDFSESLPSNMEDLDQAKEDSLEWASELETDSKGNYLSTASNINIILSKDRHLSGKFKQNLFDTKRYVFENLPWRKVSEPEPMKNVDYSGVRNYIETIYGICGTLKIDDSLALEFERHSYHPIKDYIGTLKWDNIKRIDTLMIDYFGAEDNQYTRESIRKTLLGAIYRVYQPGCKFDLVLTLVGKQGTKKSTFVKKLGKQWFSDTFMTVQGKEALEQIQGAWIIEMAELAGIRKAEAEGVKHFISKQEDSFRPAYARTSETFKRQCIFIGTTNTFDFLNDPSGNRRFMPIDVNPDKVTKDVFNDMTEEEVDQIWAEAFQIYLTGESPTLSFDAEVIAKKEQRSHHESDSREGVIIEYLDRKLSPKWDKLTLDERRIYLDGPEDENGVERSYVCIAEIWCECLNREKESMSRYNTREINEILKRLPDWNSVKSTKNFPIYGKQKYFEKNDSLL